MIAESWTNFETMRTVRFFWVYRKNVSLRNEPSVCLVSLIVYILSIQVLKNFVPDVIRPVTSKNPAFGGAGFLLSYAAFCVLESPGALLPLHLAVFRPSKHPTDGQLSEPFVPHRALFPAGREVAFLLAASCLRIL